MDVEAPDPDGAAEIDHGAARSLILRIPPAREARKPDGEDARRVARPAVDHHSGGAAVARAHGHELSPRRIGPRRTGANVHFARLQIVERTQHESERAVGHLAGARLNLTSLELLTYTYDGTGRISSRTDPPQRPETFSYDVHGNPHIWIDRNAQITTRTYDALDRLHQIEYSDASTVTYTYDERDRIRQLCA
jgi:YD repeat-containing protein